MQPGSTTLAAGAGGFSSVIAIATLSRWALQPADTHRALPVHSAAASCDPCDSCCGASSLCNSCCPELSWGSVLAFLYGEALRRSVDPLAGFAVLVFALLYAVVYGVRVQLLLPGEEAPGWPRRRDDGSRRVRAIARALGR